MAASSCHYGSLSEVWMLGPVPPPVTGMTVLTQAIVRAMQDAGPVRFLSWSPGMRQRNLRMRIKRNLRILVSMIKLVTNGRAKNQRLYLVANSQSGLYLTALLVFVGRRLGYTVYLHHHVYSYIDRYDGRMAWIDRCLAGHGYHVVHDEKMIRDFRNRYPTRNEFLVVHPSVIEIEIGVPRLSSHRPFRLGLLSSLSPAKGLDVAIDTFRALRDAGQDVTLTLAGPAPSSRAKQLIAEAIGEHSTRVRHIGPVYDGAKSRFFAEIDVFVFPTMTESWGLVLNEALGAGVPVISYDRGCTGTVVGTGAGLLIDPKDSFVRAAATQIERWIDHEDEYVAASQAAVAQAEHLHHAGQRTLADFVTHMFAPALVAQGEDKEASAPLSKLPEKATFITGK